MTIHKPITTQSAIKISLFRNPHCFTRSALEKNFTANASSINPNTTFTSVIQPPDFGNDLSQLGNMANNAKGKPNAKPNPAAPAVNGHAPSTATFANNVPSIGPVQEKETIANVPAIKNIPITFPMLDLAPALFAKPEGNPISNNPKNDKAKTTKTVKNIRFKTTLVEILLNISGLIVLLAI